MRRETGRLEKIYVVAGGTPTGVPPDARPVICAACDRFACRVCRTKTGWRHQVWCTRNSLAAPTCEDCVYWSAAVESCRHPAQRKAVGNR